MEDEEEKPKWLNPVLFGVLIFSLLPTGVYLYQWIKGIPLHLQWINLGDVYSRYVSGGDVNWNLGFYLRFLPQVVNWLEFSAAIFLLISLFFYFGVRKRNGFPLIGLAYFFSGFINLFFYLIAEDYIQQTGISDMQGSMSWIINYTALTFFLTLGLIAAIASNKSKRMQSWPFIIIASVVGVIFCVLFIISLFYLPETIRLYFPLEMIRHPFQVLLLILVLFIVYPLSYIYSKIEKTIFSKFVFISVIPLIFIGFYSIIEPHRFYSTFGWIQILEMICFLLPMIGALFTNLELYLILKRGKILAQKAVEAKTHFMATVSHQLRTPMNAILGFSQCLIEGMDGELTEKQSFSVTRIFESGKTLMSYINDVLDVSLLEGKKVRFLRRVFDPMMVINAVCKNYREVISEKQIICKILPPPREIKLHADQERIQQILSHLISNAIKSTNNGGLTIKLDLAAAYYIFEVQDTGSGISKEELGMIFSPFEKLEIEQKYVVRGRGFGLALSKKIAEEQGGDILVESELEKGSRFTLIIPYDLPQIEDGLQETFVIYVLDRNDALTKSLAKLKEKDFYSYLSITDFIQNQEIPNRSHSLVIFHHLLPQKNGEATVIENELFRGGIQTINLVPNSCKCDLKKVLYAPYDSEYQEITKLVKKHVTECKKKKSCRIAIIGDLPYESNRLVKKLEELNCNVTAFPIESLEESISQNECYHGFIFLIHFSSLDFPQRLQMIHGMFEENPLIFYCSGNQSFVGHDKALITEKAKNVLIEASVHIASLTTLLTTYIGECSE